MSEPQPGQQGQRDEEVLLWLRHEYGQKFEGWDFSYLHGRRLAFGGSSWNYISMLEDAVRASKIILDVDTGGGERLAGLLERCKFDGRVCATEGHPPNVTAARERLGPLGVEVFDVPDTNRLPFADGTFDLVMNRHGACAFVEELRVLRPGGAFITEQVGDRTNLDIHHLLGYTLPPTVELGSLSGARSAAEKAGFRVIHAGEAYPVTRYMDVGALVYYLKCIPWTIPDFSIERYADKLLALHRRVREDGAMIDIGFHLYMLVLQKAGNPGLLVPSSN